MFIQKTFSTEAIDVVRQFRRHSTWFTRHFKQIQDDLPVIVGDIKDKLAFKAPMPAYKHHEFYSFERSFNTDGSPKNQVLAPITEFCRIVLELERQAGFNQGKSLYDLNGRTEDGNDLLKPTAMPHCDGGDPLTRVYLLSDEVAPTRFGLTKTTPFNIYFFSGKTPHQAWCANPEFRDLPKIPRNVAHLRIKGGVDSLLFSF